MASGNLTQAFSVAMMLFIALGNTPSNLPNSPPIEPPTVTNSTPRNQIKRMVFEEAIAYNFPPALALAVARVESDFNAEALSSAGARGVMQIMPRTGRSEYGVADYELWNARLNVRLGIDYLSRLYRQYGGRWDLALSHYNGGTLLGQGRSAIPHRYTRRYVRSVYRWWRYYEQRI